MRRGFAYATVGDDRVRPSHTAMDGMRVPADEPRNINEIRSLDAIRRDYAAHVKEMVGPWRNAAKLLGVSSSTLQRILK